MNQRLKKGLALAAIATGFSLAALLLVQAFNLRNGVAAATVIGALLLLWEVY